MEIIANSPKHVLTANEIKVRLAANDWLIKIAVPFLNRILNALDQELPLLFLLDSNGYILHISCNADLSEKLTQNFIIPGSYPKQNSALYNGLINPANQNKTPKPSKGTLFNNDYTEWNCWTNQIQSATSEIVGFVALCLPKKFDSKLFSTILSLSANCINNEIIYKEDKSKAIKLKDQQLLLFNRHSQADMVVNSMKRIILISDKACELLGINREKIENKDIETFIPSWQDIIAKENKKNEFENIEIEVVNTQNSGHFLLNARVVKKSMGKVDEILCNLRSMKQVLCEANKYIGNIAQKTFDDIIAVSPVMKRTVKQAKIFARSNRSLYMVGNEYTGKEVIAQAIHNFSDRRNGGFVKVNLKNLSSEEIEETIWGQKINNKTSGNKTVIHGALEYANGGTIYINEIGLLPIALQDKLLSTLKEGKCSRVGENNAFSIDVRVISSSSFDLSEKIERGEFRIELFYLLSSASLTIPSLSERKADIPLLLDNYLLIRSKESKRKVPAIPKKIMLILKRYEWPENFKEMKEFVERVLADQGAMFKSFKNERDFKKRHLFLENLKQVESIIPLDEHEKQMVLKAYNAYNGSISKTSRQLGVSRNTLYLKLKKYGIG
jgi:sigma-54 dependent transcriptional regulator, acetoin dehydrogenase operon transcriptional activator AcoR